MEAVWLQGLYNLAGGAVVLTHRSGSLGLGCEKKGGENKGSYQSLAVVSSLDPH